MVRINDYETVKGEETALNRRLVDEGLRDYSQDSAYSTLCKHLDVSLDDPVNLTEYWKWIEGKHGRAEDELFLKATPPIAEADQRDSILVVGTNPDIKIMDEHLRHPHNYVDSEAVKAANAMGLEQTAQGYPHGSTKFVTDFWGDFFGDADFLEGKVTIPKGIISSGRMRKDFAHAGMTLDVSDRLAEIAHNWNMPYQQVPSAE
jgi:hypothetical protein